MFIITGPTLCLTIRIKYLVKVEIFKMCVLGYSCGTSIVLYVMNIVPLLQKIIESRTRSLLIRYVPSLQNTTKML